MRDLQAHIDNLYALHAQEGGPPGTLPIPLVAEMLVMRDELIRDLKRVIEDDARERRKEARRNRP